MIELAAPPAYPRYESHQGGSSRSSTQSPSSSWSLALRWASMGSSLFALGRAACLVSRLWRSSRSPARVGSGLLGAGPVGAQSARCRPRDNHRAPPERRSTCDRAGPDTASSVLSRRPRSSRARHTVRCLVHSHRRWGRSQPSVRSGRGSASSSFTHFDEGRRRRGRSCLARRLVDAA